MLGQRRRRWVNIETALGEFLVFSGWQQVMLTLASLEPDIYRKPNKMSLLFLKRLGLKALKYFYINQETKGLFSF